jgi:hypothetical protein
VWCLLVFKRPSHKIQRLPHGEVEAPIHSALRSPAPEPPGSRAATNPTLAAFIYIMLPKQHEHTSKQPCCLFLKDCQQDRFFTLKFASQFLKLFYKHAASGLPNVAHDSPELHSR